MTRYKNSIFYLITRDNASLQFQLSHYTKRLTVFFTSVVERNFPRESNFQSEYLKAKNNSRQFSTLNAQIFYPRSKKTFIHRDPIILFLSASNLPSLARIKITSLINCSHFLLTPYTIPLSPSQIKLTPKNFFFSTFIRDMKSEKKEEEKQMINLINEEIPEKPRPCLYYKFSL